MILTVNVRKRTWELQKEIRKQEHFKAVKYKECQCSALAYHSVVECDKEINWKSSKIVANQNCRKKKTLLV